MGVFNLGESDRGEWDESSPSKGDDVYGKHDLEITFKVISAEKWWVL